MIDQIEILYGSKGDENMSEDKNIFCRGCGKIIKDRDALYKFPEVGPPQGFCKQCYGD